MLIEPCITEEMLGQLEKKVYQISQAANNPRVWENISRPLQSALTIVEKIVRPKAVYRLFPLLELDEKRAMTQPGPIDSPMFSSLAGRSSGSRQVAFMLATLGPELENSIESSHDILTQWVYDLVGSLLMEMIADEVEDRLQKDLAKQQLQVARRFSPGYCDWSIEGQETIFKALDGAAIDVTLTPHKMMMPRKSISCVLASAESVPLKIQCLLCSKKNCPHRRRHHD